MPLCSPYLTSYFRTFGANNSRAQVIKFWWKFLAAALVLLSLIAGLAIPLGPGITSVSNTIFETSNDLSFEVTGYNTAFSSEELPQVWLQNGELDPFKGSQFICADAVSVVDGKTLSISFDPLGALPSRICHLLIYTPTNGLMVRPNALSVGSEEGATPVSWDAECSPLALAGTEPGYLHFPNREMLIETIRNLYLHVPMWFAMILLLLMSMIFSIKHLSSSKLEDDVKARVFAQVGMVLGMLGLLTGMLWAKFTWGDWWVNDSRLNGSAVTLLIYMAYFILRNSVEDESKRGRLAAVYNIFAYVMLIVFLLVLPRMVDSLHPGAGGNPAFSQYDLDNKMRLVFYPAVLGWMGMGLWMAQVRTRLSLVERKLLWKN